MEEAFCCHSTVNILMMLSMRKSQAFSDTSIWILHDLPELIVNRPEPRQESGNASSHSSLPGNKSHPSDCSFGFGGRTAGRGERSGNVTPSPRESSLVTSTCQLTLNKARVTGKSSHQPLASGPGSTPTWEKCHRVIQLSLLLCFA